MRLSIYKILMLASTSALSGCLLMTPNTDYLEPPVNPSAPSSGSHFIGVSSDKIINICVQYLQESKKEDLLQATQLAMATWIVKISDSPESLWQQFRFSTHKKCSPHKSMNNIVIRKLQVHDVDTTRSFAKYFNRTFIQCVSPHAACVTNKTNAILSRPSTATESAQIILNPFIDWQVESSFNDKRPIEFKDFQKIVQNYDREKKFSSGDENFENISSLVKTHTMKGQQSILYTPQLAIFPYILRHLGYQFGIAKYYNPAESLSRSQPKPFYLQAQEGSFALEKITNSDLLSSFFSRKKPPKSPTH